MDLKICGKCNISKNIDLFRTCKEKRTKTIKEYKCSFCKECERIMALERYKQNRDILIEKNKEYKKNNKEKINLKRRIYTQNKMLCPIERIKRNMKSLLSSKIKKKDTSKSYLGEDFNIIISWFEFNIKDSDMTWENYGKYWHIDHTIPINSFDLENDKENLICFSWMNLMPLHKTTNLKKGDKINNMRILYQELMLKKFAKSINNNSLNEKINNYIVEYSKKFNRMQHV